jgi:23S rRNA G2069 N7-methylase RlmK/C1962 C5-methylase RlmI
MSLPLCTSLGRVSSLRQLTKAKVPLSGQNSWMTRGSSWDDSKNQDEGYHLIDSGDGRKLEYFGGVVVERDCPQATWPRRKNIAQWLSMSALRYSKPGGSSGGNTWTGLEFIPADWHIKWNNVKLHLHPSPRGQQIGVFPEHSGHWAWITDMLASNVESQPDLNRKVLNCFGYTGAASLAVASVKNVHVSIMFSTLCK